MTPMTGQLSAAPEHLTRRPSVLRQMWASRADYLYVLPAIVVMLVVIAYPI